MSRQDDASRRWDKREHQACGPGSNRIRAKARRKAKRVGSKDQRRRGRRLARGEDA